MTNPSPNRTGLTCLPTKAQDVRHEQRPAHETRKGQWLHEFGGGRDERHVRYVEMAYDSKKVDQDVLTSTKKLPTRKEAGYDEPSKVGFWPEDIGYGGAAGNSPE